MSSFDLNAIVIFAKVVELESFRGAALALGMQPSTISTRVAQLEGHLQVRLLERTTRTMRLTAEGTAYYRTITPALEALRAAESTIEDLRAEPSGPLRITTTVDGGQYVLAPVLVEYMRRYPSVKLEVQLTNRRVDLIEEGFDLALRMGALADSTLMARKLATPGRIGIYAGPAYLARRGAPRTPHQLEGHDCLLMSSASEPGVWSFVVDEKPVRVAVPERASANSFVLLRDLASADLGVARLPDYIAAPAVAAGTLREVLRGFMPDSTTWHALFASARYVSPKLRALVDLLEQHYGLSTSEAAR